MPRFLILLVVLCVSNVIVAQDGDPLAAGDAAWAEGDVEGAIAAYEAALRRGDLQLESLARAYRMMGVIHSIVGDAAAEQDFARSLALNPGQDAPGELPPERRAAFEAARVRNQGALRLGFDADVTEGGIVRIAARAERAPEGLVDGLLVEATPEGSDPWREQGGIEDTVVIPAAAWRQARTMQVRVVALDAFGNRVAESTRTVERSAAVADGSQVPAGALEDDRSVAASPWLWTAVGLVVVGGIVAAVLLTRDTQYELGQPQFVPPM